MVAGLAAGLATFLLYRWLRRADEEPAAGWFRRAQTVSGSMIALAHGTSDGQKTMGVITLVLITGGYQAAGTGPQTWVIAAAGLAIGAGTYSGGWRIMRTMGKGLVDVHSPQGFAAETTSAAAILASAHMGFGLSTTQVCSGSVIGSGAGRKLSQVRWGTARKMVYGWLLTLPAAAVFGAVAAAVALTGPFGVVIVLVALLVGTVTIVAISRRTAVNRHNVNESRDVDGQVRQGSGVARDDRRTPVGERPARWLGAARRRRHRPDHHQAVVDAAGQQRLDQRRVGIMIINWGALALGGLRHRRRRHHDRRTVLIGGRGPHRRASSGPASRPAGAAAVTSRLIPDEPADGGRLCVHRRLPGFRSLRAVPDHSAVPLTPGRSTGFLQVDRAGLPARGQMASPAGRNRPTIRVRVS